MKSSVLLAAFLLLPASIASAGQGIPLASITTGTPVKAPVPGQADLPASAGRPGARTTWQWPLAPRPPVLRSFDPPPKPWLSGHRGVDLGAAGAGAGVHSPEAGTVTFVGMVVDRPVITIDHGGGLRSSFEPVESTLSVGAAVARGEEIGTVLAGHCPAAACLHWGVREGEEYVNPLQFVLDLRPSILLPLGDSR
ncbi:M23 family metallopeptidase [Pseudarthrobacter sp. C4D7]|uniref:M23 family metallopeptidase n=1 Tax=Pseudarthrobacter sp. C4D7 TaxID=2735268 RepID=UPI001585741D|nr:M23 family metallopeptidase [Pseudarthrobacter sp. C4D7]NUT71705.1 M23 family metallopeptidase [Pseudarthrobacter sp. C4D7]